MESRSLSKIPSKTKMTPVDSRTPRKSPPDKSASIVREDNFLTGQLSERGGGRTTSAFSFGWSRHLGEYEGENNFPNRETTSSLMKDAVLIYPARYETFHMSFGSSVALAPM